MNVTFVERNSKKWILRYDIMKLNVKSLNDSLQVKDHNHLNGEYRGASHVLCNLNFSHKKDIPIIIHNLKSFDQNLILKYLSINYFEKIDIIPKSVDKFLSFSLKTKNNNRLKFIDLSIFNCIVRFSH